jgi:hypothetical protein
VCIFYTNIEPATHSKCSDLPTQWGKGIYFAEDAAYSHYYATQAKPEQNDLQPDERQMMRVALILGNAVEMDRDDPGMKKRLGGRLNHPDAPVIKVPPFLNSKPPLFEGGSGAKYNTVTGFTQTIIHNRDKYGRTTVTPNPACPRSRVWSVRLLHFVRLNAVNPSSWHYATLPACLPACLV